MCWQCDHPGKSVADYLDHLRGVIAEHGWAVQGVEPDRLRPPWAYTAGMTESGLPELVVTGLSFHRAANLLHAVAGHALHARCPRPGDRVRLVAGPLIQIVKVDHPDVHLVTATALYGPRVRALQVVHADDRDRWPWEAGYRGIRGGQPVLGIPLFPQPARR